MNLHHIVLPLSLVIAAVSGQARADYFNCVETGGCAEPALFSSNTCAEDVDYEIDVVDRSSEVSVLAIHGGRIELKTSEIAEDMAQALGYNAYTFSADATPGCLNGLSNTGRLHVTATHFDEGGAMALVEDSDQVVTIHGYSTSRGYANGVICVGGQNESQRQAFIDYVDAHAGAFAAYNLQPIDAPTSNGDCADLAGTASANIVNLGQDPDGGLQLELGMQMRKDLVKVGASWDTLRSIIYGAVEHAMGS